MCFHYLVADRDSQWFSSRGRGRRKQRWRSRALERVDDESLPATATVPREVLVTSTLQGSGRIKICSRYHSAREYNTVLVTNKHWTHTVYYTVVSYIYFYLLTELRSQWVLQRWHLYIYIYRYVLYANIWRIFPARKAFAAIYFSYFAKDIVDMGRVGSYLRSYLFSAAV